MTTFISADEAVSLIHDHATFAHSGFVGAGLPDFLLKALRDHFDRTGSPQGLTYIKSIGDSDKKGRGADRLAADGLISTIITSHTGLEPALSRYIHEEKCLAYMIPLGTLLKLFRAQAAHQPGVWTRTGLMTFIDPRLEGGKVNLRTQTEGNELVRLVEVDGKEYLYYPSLPIQVCFIRGTYADEDGNILMDKESLIADQFELAAAAHASKGIVIAQVEGIVERRSFDARRIVVPRMLVDYVVQAPPAYHCQSLARPDFLPELTGAIRTPLTALQPLPLDARKVCASRAVQELQPQALINLGIGMPQGVAAAAAEKGLADGLTFSVESGVLGGVPLTGTDMGAALNPEAICKTADMLDLYDGGCLDLAVLCLAEIDRLGNINVSKFNGHVTGPGGFIDIAQNTKRLIFMGTFTAGGLKEEISQGKLHIVHEGAYKKFKQTVEQITFSAAYAVETGQDVLIVTERAVFRLTADGLVLTEIAPGIRLEEDVLAQMDFRPRLAEPLLTMDTALFT